MHGVEIWGVGRSYVVILVFNISSPFSLSLISPFTPFYFRPSHSNLLSFISFSHSFYFILYSLLGLICKGCTAKLARRTPSLVVCPSQAISEPGVPSETQC